MIDAEDCLLQPLAATRLREAFKLWMERYQVPAYDERVHGGLIRHFYVRVNRRGQSLCAVIANGTDLPHQEELVQALRRAEPDLAGWCCRSTRRRPMLFLGKTHRCLWGRDYLEDTLCGLTFRLSVPSFYQVNREQAEVLYGRALAFAGLTGRETVLDLYCGIGTITLVMARQAKRAIGAEVIPAAVEDAKANAARNEVTNAEFLCADAAQAAQTLADRGLRPDVICVDPPRKGLAPAVIDAIVQMAPQRLVYVSCDPATLARDVKRMEEQGYVLQRAEAVDLFPRTAHVETVCLLSKLNAKQHIEVEIKMDELDLTAAESKATYEEIKAYVLEHSGMKVSSLYIAQVKQKCGIIERENYNKPKSEDAKQPQCPVEKQAAIMEALKYFNMI
ncbi:MAG: 23S rRNA (uracil(1939)-C(5))-methyltransferase RlmD [Evtepia gabavorous]